jgi:hypothetical protein
VRTPVARRIGAIAAMVLVACQPRSAPQGQALDYEPAVVVLRGRLQATERFGPPNYGEDPRTDARQRILLVRLPEQVVVRADTADPVNNETVAGVREVQLLLSPEAVAQYVGLLGREVIVQGTLSRAVTGHHYTPVVMTIRDIRPATR